MLDAHDPVRKLLDASPLLEGDIWCVERTMAQIACSRSGGRFSAAQFFTPAKWGLASVMLISGMALAALYWLGGKTAAKPQTISRGHHQVQVLDAGS